MKKTTEKLIGEMTYISETDSPLETVRLGKVTQLTPKAIAELAGIDPKLPATEMSADKFFERLTRTEKWHGAIERKAATDYKTLRKALESELTELKVFRFGTIQIDIYIIGIDELGRLAGVKTKAVET